jgi:hypothetical protein
MHVHPELLDLYISSRRADLVNEAEQDRLAALATKRSTTVRHDLAVLCHRLANWLDGADRYARTPDSGRSDWVRGATSA